MNYQDFKLNNLTDIPTPIEKDQDTRYSTRVSLSSTS